MTCFPSTCLLNPIQAESLGAKFPASVWPYTVLPHLGGSGSWEVLGMGRWLGLWVICWWGSLSNRRISTPLTLQSIPWSTIFGLLNILLYVFPASLLPTYLSPHSLQNWHRLLNCALNDGKCFEQWVWVCRFSTASLRNLGQIVCPSGTQLFTCKLGMLDYMKSTGVLALEGWMKGVVSQPSLSYSKWHLCLRTFLTQKCHWLL